MKKVWVIHPFLFALWPILFVYSQNLEHLSLSQIWTSVLVLLGFTLVFFFLLLVLLRNAMRAGLLLSLFLILFFSYGQAYRILWGGQGGESLTNRQSILMAAWAILYLAGTALLIRIKRGLEDITKIVNVVALVLVLTSAFNVGSYELRRKSVSKNDIHANQVKIEQTHPVQADMLPDVYYIILDGYARADVLADIYNYDNSGFLSFLREKGFFVASKSQSNYAHTALSLASSLNLTYLDAQAAEIGLDSTDREPLGTLIKNSAVIQFLKEQGYSIVAFPTGYSITDLDNADIYFGQTRSLNELEIGLLSSTPIPWLAANQSSSNPYASHAHRIRYTLDHLAETAQLPSPHFVFAHVLGPHPPFVLDEQGRDNFPEGEFNLGEGSHFLETNTRAEYLAGYTAQLTFITNRMESILDDLISQSSRPAIIIVQADHGPGSLLDWDHPENTYFRERLSILDAYLLPGTGAASLYDEITPVNTFRLIFNTYFGTDLQKLPDKSYFSTWERPYQFIDVTDDVRSDRPAPNPE
jgi:hypothetical protein